MPRVRGVGVMDVFFTRWTIWMVFDGELLQSCGTVERDWGYHKKKKKRKKKRVQPFSAIHYIEILN